MKRLLRDSWLLLAMAVVFSSLLAGAQTALGPRIERNRQTAREAAVFAVVPGAERLQAVRVASRTVYRCLDAQGGLAGWGVAATGFGFQDRISLVVGLSADASTITGLKIVEDTETPGLGNRIEDDGWGRQYAGLDARHEVELVKGPRSRERSQVQAITGATISSAAVTSIVNGVLAEVCPQLETQNPLRPEPTSERGKWGIDGR